MINHTTQFVYFRVLFGFNHSQPSLLSSYVILTRRRVYTKLQLCLVWLTVGFTYHFRLLSDDAYASPIHALIWNSMFTWIPSQPRHTTKKNQTAASAKQMREHKKNCRSHTSLITPAGVVAVVSFSGAMAGSDTSVSVSACE